MRTAIYFFAITELLSACYAQKPIVKKVEPGYSDVLKQLGRVHIGEVYRFHLREGNWVELRVKKVDSTEVTGLTNLTNKFGAGLDTVKYKAKLTEKSIPVTRIKQITKWAYDSESTSGLVAGIIIGAIIVTSLLANALKIP